MEKDIDTLIQEITQYMALNSDLKDEGIMKKLEALFKVCEKSKDKSIFIKLSSVVLKLPIEFYNIHLSDLLRLHIKFSDRHIYKLFLEVDDFEPFLQKESNYYDSKNKISVYIIIQILKTCSPKEIILFFNEHLNEINIIEKKFYIIEVYNRILGKLEKKELFLDQILPLILMTFSSAIQKFIKNKEKLTNKPDLVANKDIILNFEKYAINLIRRIMKVCKGFKELEDPSIQHKLLTINDIFEYNYETGLSEPKQIPPNLLLKHYIISFVLDIMEGVLDATSTAYFDKKMLNEFLGEIINYLFDLHRTKIDYITCYLTQIRYFSIMKVKPASIKENLKNYDKLYAYNCLSIANLLLTILQEDDSFNLIYSLKYKLNLMMPVIYENLKAVDSKLELFLPLIKELAKILNNDVLINKKNPFEFENLNVFNVPFSDFVNQILEISGSFSSNEENRKVMVDVSNKLSEMPNEKGKFKMISNIFNKSNNANLIAYMMNTTKKKIQFFLGAPTNDIDNPLINAKKIEKLFDSCLNKNKFSGISTKVELVNELINFMIYLLTRFSNFQTEKQEFVPDETHLLSPASKPIYENILNSLFSLEKEIKDELDNMSSVKKEIVNDPKKSKEEKDSGEAEVERKINQLLLLVENLKKLKEIKYK